MYKNMFQFFLPKYQEGLQFIFQKMNDKWLKTINGILCNLILIFIYWH